MTDPEQRRVDQAVMRACTHLRRLALDPGHAWTDDDRDVMIMLLDLVEDAAVLGIRPADEGGP